MFVLPAVTLSFPCTELLNQQVPPECNISVRQFARHDKYVRTSHVQRFLPLFDSLARCSLKPVSPQDPC